MLQNIVDEMNIKAFRLFKYAVVVVYIQRANHTYFMVLSTLLAWHTVKPAACKQLGVSWGMFL